MADNNRQYLEAEKLTKVEEAEGEADKSTEVEKDEAGAANIYKPFGKPEEVIITSTKNALLMRHLYPYEAYPHCLKVSIVGAKKVGMACAIAILMRRIASEVCLIDQNSNKVSAAAEDIRHAGIFLGCPLVTGTTDVYQIKGSAVVVLAVCEKKSGEEVNVKQIIETFRKIIPIIAKVADKAVLVVVTQPIDVMSYVVWKLSKLPSGRVLGTGTLLNSSRLQDLLSQKLGMARTSVSCISIGAQGDSSVPVWSSVHVAGTRICDINPKIGKMDDPEKWYDIADAANKIEAELNRKKDKEGPSCWALGFCTAEIVDAILRNTKVVLPVSTYVHACYHGTDKDVYVSLPCVIGREGVHARVRQTLNEHEKTALQHCADNNRNVLRECGILRKLEEDVEE